MKRLLIVASTQFFLERNMRKYLFEFEDFDWYPESFRNLQTDFLQLIMQTFNVFENVYPRIFDVVKKTKQRHFIDLGSGGGGVIKLLRKAYKNTFQESFRATLTDKHPNIEAFKKINKDTNGEVDFYETSVDINNIPKELNGFWTVFNVFHHLSPYTATKFLKSTVIRSVPLVIIEPLDKNILTIMFQSFFLVFFLFLTVPFLRSFNLKILIFTYLIPILPFCIVWDGWISVLKVYSLEDMKRIIRIADYTGKFEWDLGTEKHKFGRVNYLVGYQKKNI